MNGVMNLFRMLGQRRGLWLSLAAALALALAARRVYARMQRDRRRALRDRSVEGAPADASDPALHPALAEFRRAEQYINQATVRLSVEQARATAAVLPPTALLTCPAPQKLKVYGLYKQATMGPCQKPRPSAWDAVGSAKWCVRRARVVLWHADDVRTSGLPGQHWAK